MSKITYAFMMLVAGVGINYLTGNIIFSFIGCSLIGLGFNAKRIIQSKKTSKFEKSELGLSPKEYLNKFKLLKDHVTLHDYDYDMYKNTVYDSIFIDTDGIIWSLGLETLEWYQLKNDNWIRAEPKNKMILINKAEAEEHIYTRNH